MLDIRAGLNSEHLRRGRANHTLEPSWQLSKITRICPNALAAAKAAAAGALTPATA